MAEVQFVSSTGTSSGTSVTFPTFTAIGTGNGIIGILQFRATSNIVSNLQVGSTNATLITGDFVNFVGNHCGIPFYLFNITGGPTTITVNFTTTPPATDQYLNFGEYSNQTGIEQHNVFTSNGGATSASASITTSAAGQTIWTGLNCPGTGMSFPPGFNTRNNDVTLAQRSADEVQVTPGLITPTWSWSGGATTCYYSVISLLPLVPGVAAWDALTLQPPGLPNRRYRPAGSLISGDRFEFAPLPQGYKRAYAGFDLQPTQEFQPPSPRVLASRWANSAGERFEHIRSLSSGLPYVPMGWEPNVPQPPTPQLRRDQAAAIMPREDGNEAKLIPVPYVAYWDRDSPYFELPNPIPPRQRFAAMAPREDGNEAKLIFISPTPAGTGFDYIYHFQPPNPSRPSSRKAAIAPIAPGIEGKLVPLPFVAFGREPLLHQPRVTSVRVNVAAAIMPIELGTEFPLFFGYTGPITSGPISAAPITAGPFVPGTQVPVSPFAWDTGPQPFYQSRAQALDRAGIAVTVAGEQPLDILRKFLPMGWEIQPPQPPASPRRVAAVVIPTGEQPMDILRRFVAPGWEIQAPTPPRFPQNEQRMAAMMPYEDGIENIFTFHSANLITTIGGWVQDFQPPRAPRPTQIMAGMMPQAQGIDAALAPLVFIPIGWELQQPHFPMQIRKFVMPDSWTGKILNTPTVVAGIIFDGLSIEALPLPFKLLARRMVLVGEAAGGFPQISPLIPPAPPKPALVISGYPGVPF